MARGAGSVLDDRIRDDLGRAMALLGIEHPLDAEGTDQDICELTALAIELIAERLHQEDAAAEVAISLLRLHRDLLELNARARDARLAALMNVQDALSRLRGPTGVRELVRQAPIELCRSCGYDRVLLMRVDERTLVVEAAAGTAVTLNSLAVADGQAEATVLAERTAALIDDASGLSALAPALGAVSVAVAPVVSAGEVVGVLAADCAASGRPLQRIDRDALAAFASGLGYAIEKAILLERLHAQRDDVLRLVRAAEMVAGELSDAQMRLSSATEPDAALGPVAALLADTAVPVADLLSPRELEVMDAMSRGATNGEIGELLFISEDTVKSHVKRILAKLGATNRVDAVSRFVRAVVEHELRLASLSRAPEVHSVKR